MLVEMVDPSLTGWLGTVVEAAIRGIPIRRVQIEVAKLLGLIYARTILENSLS